MLPSYNFAITGQPEKRHNVRAQKQEVVSDWLNPISLGIMSAPSYIESVA